jgi:hypothetical protein
MRRSDNLIVLVCHRADSPNQKYSTADLREKAAMLQNASNTDSSQFVGTGDPAFDTYS